MIRPRISLSEYCYRLYIIHIKYIKYSVIMSKENSSITGFRGVFQGDMILVCQY